MFDAPRRRSAPGWLAALGAGAAAGVLLVPLAVTLNSDLETGPALLVPLALFTPALRPAADALTVREAAAPADAIVVLGAGLHCGTRDLEGASLARLVRGLELWRAGYAQTLTVSNPPPGFFGAG